MARARSLLSEAPDSSFRSIQRNRSKKPLTARELNRAALTALEWPKLNGPVWTFGKNREPIVELDDVNNTNTRAGCPALQIARMRKQVSDKKAVHSILDLLIYEYMKFTTSSKLPNGRCYVTDMHRNPKAVAWRLYDMANEVGA